MTTPDPDEPEDPDEHPAPAPLDRARAVAMAAVLSALADPVRLQVFQAIRDHGPDGATFRDVLAPLRTFDSLLGPEWPAPDGGSTP